MKTFIYKLLLGVLFLLMTRPALAQISPPSNLKATASSSVAIDLTWSLSSQTLAYEVERSLDGKSFSKIGETAAIQPGVFAQGTYTDQGLSPATHYYYRVRGKVTATTFTTYSNSADATTNASPAAPTGLAVSVTGTTTLHVVWTVVRGGVYSLERRTGQTGTFAEVTSSTTGQYDDTGLTPGTEYCYRVRIKNTAGETSAYSSIACATTTAVPPVNPFQLSVQVISDTQLEIFWQDANVVPVTFDLERASKTGGTYTIIATNLTSKIYDDKGLTAATQYCYRVRAKNSAGVYSGYSNEACGTTKAPVVTIPNAPSRLTVTAVSSSQINLQWADLSDNETGFQVERASSSTGTFTKLVDLPANTTTYSDQGLSRSTQYCYRVRAVNTAGNSGYTDVQCATTLTPAPDAPQNLAATAASTTQINLTWYAVAGATAYQLERSPNGNDSWTKLADPIASAISYSDQNLLPNTRYYYRIRAVNGGGAGTYSNIANATTPDAPPTAPARLTATVVTYAQINLQWADLSSNETGFQVERATGSPTATFTKIADVGANSTTYSDQSVQGSTQYCYRVRAVNAVGNSGYTDVQCATTPVPPAGVPQNLAASASSTTQINLTWTGVTGANSYQLERSPDGNTWTKIADPAANATSYADNGLMPNTKYYYRIRALNATGAPGDYSNMANATTPDAPPVAPARLTATVASFSQINLQWADLSSNESGFDIEISTDGTTFKKIADVGANVTSYNSTNLNPRTHYYYRIRAVNAAGPSPYSNVADATTPDSPPAVPTQLTATPASATGVALAWTDASDNETSFEIQRSLDGANWSKLADVPANTTSYIDNGLTATTKYYYRVRAVNAVGVSGFSNTADATTPDVPPAAPTRLTATAISPNQINLQWADLSSNESGFEVERSNSATGTFQKVADLPANATTYEDKNLTDNTPYCYRVRAKNAAGPSAYTDPACVSTPLAPPVIPTNLTAQVFDYDQIKLNWSPVGASAVTVYIERSISPTSGFVEIKQQPVGATFYIDMGLQAFTTYYYRIRVSNAAGYSGYSNVATARVDEVIIAVEDELETHTTLFVSQRTLHVMTNWFSTMNTTVQLLTPMGQPVVLDHRKVNPSDRWSYNLDTLPTGSYIISIVADGRKLAKRILLP